MEKKSKSHCLANWFVFEMFLKKRAARENTKILKLTDCYEVGELLHMNSEECEAALGFLTKLNILFYDPAGTLDHKLRYIVTFHGVFSTSNKCSLSLSVYRVLFAH